MRDGGFYVTADGGGGEQGGEAEEDARHGGPRLQPERRPGEDHEEGGRQEDVEQEVLEVPLQGEVDAEAAVLSWSKHINIKQFANLSISKSN